MRKITIKRLDATSNQPNYINEKTKEVVYKEKVFTVSVNACVPPTHKMLF